MNVPLAALRYARALADIVFSSPAQLSIDDVIRQMRSVEDLFAASPELQSVLLTPAVPVPRKKAVLATFAKELGLSTLVRNLLFVLIDHRRITLIGEIRVAFEDMVDEHLGFVRGEVQSAEPLDKSQLDALQTELDAISGKRVKMKTSVDPSLLGGVVARLGSTVYDGSIRGQLNGMRRKLSSESAQ